MQTTEQTTDTSSKRLRVAVLMGGASSERAISLSTGKMIVSGLNPSKYEVVAMDTQDLFALTGQNSATLLAPGQETEGRAEVEGKSEESESEDTPSSDEKDHVESRNAGNRGVKASEIENRKSKIENSTRPDVIFIALHGKGGEDGTMQGLLELMGLPYTGSGVLASALAMDKVMSKRLFKSADIPVIAGLYVKQGTGEMAWTEERLQQTLLPEVEHQLGFPVFVKPSAGGSTFGCTLVKAPGELFAAVQKAHEHDDTALIEKYIRGTEITIGILETPDNGPLQVLPVVEIVPKAAYYDHDSKYAEGGSDHIIPARLSETLTHQAQEIAKRCHSVLGCRGVSRTDMILAGDEIYVLETNTIPGMTPTSLLPQAAAHVGISFSDLLDRLISLALENPSHGNRSIAPAQ